LIKNARNVVQVYSYASALRFLRFMAPTLIEQPDELIQVSSSYMVNGSGAISWLMSR